MNKNLYYQLFIFIFSMGVLSCELEEIPNDNQPTRESLLEGASVSDLQFLVTGLESLLRSDMEYHYWTVSMVGREYYDLRGTDPRYTGELLGINGAPLDNNGFLTTRAFNQVYRVARQANDLITSIENSSTSLSESELNSIKGIANTYKVYSLSLELNRQYQNGIRVDVADEDNLGAFLSYDESLNELQMLLDESISQVKGGMPVFPVNLTNPGASTLEEFLAFQHALAARIAMYRGDKDAVLRYLEDSFYNPDGSLYDGVYHVFGQSGNDIANPLFVGTSDYLAHPSFAAEAEDGDKRVDEKTTLLEDAVALDNLQSNRRVSMYESNISPVPLIRNEELILLAAEANIGHDNDEATRLINIIRNAAGLRDTNANSENELIDELLQQRRYSLFGEGHRWIDLRRYNRLDELPIDREGDIIHEQFPRPAPEID